MKQLAVYFPTVTHPKRSKAGILGRHHAHQHLHQQNRALQDLRPREAARRGVGDVVSVTMNGQVVSWTNVYAGPADPTSLAAPVAAVPEMEIVTPWSSASVIGAGTRVPLFSPDSIGNETESPQFSPMSNINTEAQILGPSPDSRISTETQILRPSSTSSSNTAKGSKKEVGSWTRQAYYNAAGGVSDGFTFLNHFGGLSGIPGTADGGAA